MSTFYVTTPIYYVNDLPHIGHIFTTVVADSIARYRRLAGDDVRFLTGTDEHGQKIERAAAAQNVTPIALADRVVERYHQLWRTLGITHDDFIRTTEPRHMAGVAAIIERLEAAGDLYLARHEGWYCTACETYYTEKELVGDDKRCPDHDTPTEWKSEENLFFRLSKYAEPLLAHYRAHPEFIQPDSRRNEILAFVEGGLKDLSVSRSNVAWGIPFPDHPGHTVYVWLDALSNYVTALGFGQTDRALADRYWDGGNVRLHLVGKDILRFHSVYWPAFLLSAGLPLPTTIWAHGWWLRDARKMSKSSGNVVRPDHLIERFGADTLRYFLLREMVFGLDATFSDEAFVERYNADLANDLGNTVSRLVTLAKKNFDGATPPRPETPGPLAEVAARAVAEYRAAFDQLAFSRGLEALWRLLAETNGRIVTTEPWKLAQDPARRDELVQVLWDGLEAVRIVAAGLLPVMPELAARVLAAVGAPVPTSLEQLAWGGLPAGSPLPDAGSLFPRIDKKAFLAEIAPAAGGSVTEEAAKPAESAATPEGVALITIDKFFEARLRVATVVAAEAVPKSSKLLKLQVDLGDEQRQIVAGIAAQYTPEALVGTQVVIVANLQPAKLMGNESQGMVLAASIDGKPVLVRPEAPVPNGTQVR
jgi:methionyl-tRNA synthetase